MNPKPSTTPGMGETPPQQVLARKLQLLLDASIAGTGKLVTFRIISQAMASRGVNLSRARWFYMKDATGPCVRNVELLTALADYFNIDPNYLLGVDGSRTPSLITDNMDFIRALRASRVLIFAERELGGLLPETLREIARILEQDMALSPLGAAAGRLGPRHQLSAPFPSSPPSARPQALDAPVP